MMSALRQKSMTAAAPLPPTPPSSRALATVPAAPSGSAGPGWRLRCRSSTQYATVLGLNMVMGPPAGMSFGCASGLGHVEVFACGLFAETAQMLVVDPLFVLGWSELVDTRRIAPFMARLRTAAESGERRVQRMARSACSCSWSLRCG
jgi:hypothetical protein